ncbi:hypothetical protein C8J57DRAFT_1222170 [Mycena rebaudengoi]|nr:hypothetical protein C8J57DRAFT_1222170 [Mycena rebaudengoi]
MLAWFKQQLELSCIAAENEVVLGQLSELEDGYLPSFKASQSARCNTVVGQSELKMNESVDETVRRARVEGFMLTWFKRQLELSCIAAGNEVVLGRLSELEAVGQRFDQDGVYGCADTMEIIRIRIPTEFGSTEKAREIE